MSTVTFSTPSVTVSSIVGAAPHRLTPARGLRALRAVRAAAEAAFEVVVLGEYEGYEGYEGYGEQAGIRRRHRHVHEGRERHRHVHEGRERPGEYRT